MRRGELRVSSKWSNIANGDFMGYFIAVGNGGGSPPPPENPGYRLTPCDSGSVIDTTSDLSSVVGDTIMLADGNIYTVSSVPNVETDTPVNAYIITPDCNALTYAPCEDEDTFEPIEYTNPDRILASVFIDLDYIKASPNINDARYVSNWHDGGDYVAQGSNLYAGAFGFGCTRFNDPFVCFSLDFMCNFDGPNGWDISLGTSVCGDGYTGPIFVEIQAGSGDPYNVRAVNVESSPCSVYILPGNKPTAIVTKNLIAVDTSGAIWPGDLVNQVVGSIIIAVQ